MIIYQRGNKALDTLLLQWWAELEPDRARLFHTPLHPLGSFFQYFQMPAVCLLLELDENERVWFAAWIEAGMFDGAGLSAWCRPDYRGKRRELEAFDRMVTLFLERFPVLIGITKQIDLYALHLKLGYIYSGTIPGIWDGQPVWIFHLTKETRANRHVIAAQIRRARREQREQAYGIGQRQIDHIDIADEPYVPVDGGEPVRSGVPGIEGTVQPDAGSPKDRRRRRRPAHHQSGDGREPVGVQQLNRAD